MYLTIDKGNTRMKWALFEGDQLVRLSEEGEGLPDEEVDAAWMLPLCVPRVSWTWTNCS